MAKTNNQTKDPYELLLKRLLSFYQLAGSGLVLVAFALLFSNSSPNIWYRVNAEAVNNDSNTLVSGIGSLATLQRVKEIPLDSQGEPVAGEYLIAEQLPKKNSELPKGLHILIPKIGVQTEVNRDKDAYEALDKGVWMPADLALPHEENNPIVMAAHRFGYISWSNEFRRTSSFYNLPELETGDEIIIISDQREFKYRVQANFEAEESIKLTHDLTLYTCKFFDSDSRIVVTAQRVRE